MTIAWRGPDDRVRVKIRGIIAHADGQVWLNKDDVLTYFLAEANTAREKGVEAVPAVGVMEFLHDQFAGFEATE